MPEQLMLSNAWLRQRVLACCPECYWEMGKQGGRITVSFPPKSWLYLLKNRMISKEESEDAREYIYF